MGAALGKHRIILRSRERDRNDCRLELCDLLSLDFKFAREHLFRVNRQEFSPAAGENLTLCAAYFSAIVEYTPLHSADAAFGHQPLPKRDWPQSTPPPYAG